MRNKFLFLCLLLFGTLTACKDTKWVDVPTGTPPEGAITGKPGEPEEPDDPTVKSFINCSYIRGDFFEKNRHKTQRKAKFYLNNWRSVFYMQGGLKQTLA